MTGICGIWYRDGRPEAARACGKMQAALAIYGPDRADTWDGGEVALGCRLKRLLPEDRFDRQPVTSADGRFALVADVRLDNRQELAELLGIRGERLAEMADSTVLMAAWEAWGEESIGRLFGDFAFAVWDERERRMALARDYPGMRPLFYHQGRGWMGFASMAKGLHALPDVPRAADPDTLRTQLLFAPMKGPGSFFAGINRVEPGGVTVMEADGRIRSRIWYSPPAHKLPELGDPRGYVEQMRQCFDRAVADRLRTDSRVASTLSGGLDSSAVTATAALQLGESGRRLTAYTHVPLSGVPLEASNSRICDEGPLAKLVASRYPAIDHVLVDAPERQIGDDLDQTFYYAESPVRNLCNSVWITEIARLAGLQGHSTLLVGTWGNKTISESALEGLPALLYSGRLLAWARDAGALRASGAMSLKGLTFWNLRPLMTNTQEHRLRTALGMATHGPQADTALSDARDACEQGLAQLDRDDPVIRRLPRDRIRFVQELMRQQEGSTLVRKGLLARYGVDHRDPTADRRLLDLCFALPDSLFHREGQPRWLYDQVFADRVPENIRLERRKGLAGADWAERLRRAHPVIQDEIHRAASCAGAASLLDLEEMRALIDELPATAEALNAAAKTYRLKLLRGVSVAHFLRRVSGGNA